MTDLAKYKTELYESKILREIFDRIIGNSSNDIDTFERFLEYGEPENELSKEEIHNVFVELERLGLIEEVKNELSDFYKVKREDLIDGFFIQNISSEIYKQKYQLKDGKNKNELIDLTPYHTFIRVALAVSLVNTRYSRKLEKHGLNAFKTFVDDFLSFFYISASGRATGAGRVVSNAGSKLYKTYTTLINCTVMRQIPDSMQGIMETLTEASLTLKAGAGTGYDFSSIRPKGAFVHGAGAETSGVVSFAEIFDKMCSTIMSAGGRRGAQMLVIDVRHPESVDLFTAKRNDGVLRYFNISLLFPNSLMEKVKNDDDFEQWFWTYEKTFTPDKVIEKNGHKVFYIDDKEVVIVDDGKLPYEYEEYDYFAFGKEHQVMKHESFGKDEYRIYKKEVFKKIKAREIYDIVMQSTYDYAEPGIIFIDNVNNKNVLRGKEYIRTTNPCGEQPLPPYGSCNLGSIFLHRFVKEPFNYDLKPEENFDFDALFEVARLMNRFLDFVNDITNLPLVKLKEAAFTKRRHGLGISGIADTLIMVGLRYGSEEAAKFLEKIMYTIQLASAVENVRMAEIYGPAPIGITLKEWVDVFDHLREKLEEIYGERFHELPLRYSHATSIAPTGTISLTFGNNVANGIEPTFALSYMRNIRTPGKKTKTQEEVYSFAAILFKNYFGHTNYNEHFVTTNDITVDEHIRMQASAQKYVDSAISKTCNIPTDYPFEMFKDAYIRAYELGLKGFTTFRFNPKFSVGVLVKKDDLENLLIEFETDTGEKYVVKGSDIVVYDGEEHVAANLYEALKEGIYGRM